MDFGDLYIVSLIPENQFMMDINKYIPFVILILILALCLMSLVGYVINQWVILPLNRLNSAINALKSGDLDTKIQADGVCEEYEGVNNAFNEMVHEIKSLKIDVYEEKIVRQRIHTQYLKLQITPHFLINCLSMVYQLAEINRTDLVQLMLKNLSNYLRYTISSGQTVTLEQELTHIDNYIALSKIRYPDSISFHSEISPETLQAKVIPLLLQSFVENTIKYEVVLGKVIEIHINTSMIQKENNAFISITIWDTGCGFDKELLDRLQNIDQYLHEESTKHIGISNVLQRAYLQFDPENCDFHFSNRPEGGARIDIVLPFIPCVIKEETF
ncbi:sensor histidine kinase [Anaerobium acetethylicum]|uniref:Two-component system, sensor histidine kinase YesM n=1 Tax=Anaerobium acetethylicum TaxID=1619234 RepID=A0A1D3TSV9_9FIRM|nr:histidine kinase [Anaerobium acetethylicum]SCP96989.1 two-component system, sensor histidine kinase YesM [Anaerobium acetethylicum]